MTSPLVEQVTEKQFQDTVIRMAALLGWRYYHPYDSRRSVPGYPDLTLCHPRHGTVWLELKRERGRVSKAQRQWLDTLTAAGERAYVVRPSQVDAVERLLRGETERLEDAE